MSVALVFLAGLLLVSILVTGAESTFLIESGADLENISKFQSIVITISAAILGMLPIGMFLLTSTSLAASTIKFAKRDTLPQDLYSIEMIAMVDTLLLDKTGTITDGKLEIVEEKSFTNDKIKLDELFATIVNATKDQNSTANAIREHYLYAKTIEHVSCTPFSSQRKYSAITLSNGINYLMGAPDFITRNTPYVEEFVERNALEGRRTLALVEFRGDIDDFTPEKGRCLGAISLEDRLRGDVKETLDWFRENDVDIRTSRQSGAHHAHRRKMQGHYRRHSFLGGDHLPRYDNVQKLAWRYCCRSRNDDRQYLFAVDAQLCKTEAFPENTLRA